MSVGKLRPAGRSLAPLVVIACGIALAAGGLNVRAADPAGAAKRPATAPKTPARAGKHAATVHKPAKPAVRQAAASRKTRSLPSVKAIQAAYRKNFAKLMPLGVEYRISITEHQAAIDADRRRLREKQALVKLKRSDIKVNGEAIDEEQYNAIVRDAGEQLQYLNSALADEAVKKRLAGWVAERRYLWTDGKAFHMRAPHDASAADVKLFPAALTPAENLPKLYSSIVLASWSKANHPPLRCWFGGSNGGGGRVANALHDCISITSFAPVGFVNNEWTHKWDWHELDHFMTADPSHFRVVRVTKIKGRTLIIVDEVPTDNPTATMRERVRAWIDPAQGCLPLRLEWSYVKTADNSVTPYHRDLKILAVKQVEGGHYPLKIRRREFVRDEKALEKQRQEQAAGRIAKDAPPPSLAPGRTINFEATEIAAKKEIEPAALALEFPSGALYTNAVDNRTYRTGDPQPLPLPPEPIQPGQAAPPLKIAAWTDSKSLALGDLRGKVVVLVFSQKLGDPQEDESNGDAIAAMKGIYAKFAPQGAVFVEIFGAGTDMQRVLEFQKTRGWKCAAGIDETADPASGATSRKYLGGSDAGFIVIDRDGRVAFNADALEEETAMQVFAQAANALSIPWPLDENAPEDQLNRQQLQIFEYIVTKEIDKALAKKK